MIIAIAAGFIVGLLRPPSDIEGVVGAVIDGFFVTSNSDFNKGDVVLLNPKWSRGGMNAFGHGLDPDEPYDPKSKKPMTFEKAWAKWTFDKAISTWIEKSEYRLKSESDKSAFYLKWRKEEIERLATIKRVQMIESRAVAVVQSTRQNPTQLTLGPKVVLGTWSDFLDKKDRYGWSAGEQKVKRKDGTVVTVRTVGSMTEPIFSRDSKYAFASISIPWSIHSASFIYLLEKQNGGWRIIAKQENYYV